MSHSYRQLLVWQKARVLAEGQGRLTKGEFRHFLGQARGSLLELETQLEIASDLGFLDHSSHESLQQRAYETLGLLNRFISSLRNPAPATETLKPVKL
jgi:four helix bundle protein